MADERAGSVAALYTAGKTRTNATGGIVWLTFTPLLGMSTVVHSFRHAAGDRF